MVFFYIDTKSILYLVVGTYLSASILCLGHSDPADPSIESQNINLSYYKLL